MNHPKGNTHAGFGGAGNYSPTRVEHSGRESSTKVDPGIIPPGPGVKPLPKKGP